MKKRSEFLDTILQFNPHYDIELIGELMMWLRRCTADSCESRENLI